MAALVVYYSKKGENHSKNGIVRLDKGNTAYVAEFIAEKIGAPIFEIEPETAYPDNYKECVAAAVEQFKGNARPALKSMPDMSGVDTLFVGFPDWCGTMPMVVWTFLEKCPENITIVPFCTHGGSGMKNAPADIEKLCPTCKVEKGFEVLGDDAKDSKTAVFEWLRSR